MRRSTKLLLFFLCTAVIFQIGKIIFESTFTTAGIALTQMKQQISKLEKENLIISEVVYKKMSLTYISSEAEKNGFIESQKDSSIVLSNSSVVALKQ